MLKSARFFLMLGCICLIVGLWALAIGGGGYLPVVIVVASLWTIACAVWIRCARGHWA